MAEYYLNNFDTSSDIVPEFLYRYQNNTHFDTVLLELFFTKPYFHLTKRPNLNISKDNNTV